MKMSSNISHEKLLILILAVVCVNSIDISESGDDRTSEVSYEDHQNTPYYSESEEMKTGNDTTEPTTMNITEADVFTSRIDGDFVKTPFSIVYKTEEEFDFKRGGERKIEATEGNRSKEEEKSHVDEAQDISDYSYSVSIQRKGSHIATGALLDENWVMTAATYLFNVRESIKIYNARLGAADCKRGQKLPLKQLEIHPSFKRGSPNYDLAMVKLAYPVKFDINVKPVPLSNRNGWSVFVVTYWPRILENSDSISDRERAQYKHMRYRDEQAMAWDTCYKILRSMQVFLTENSRCVKHEHAHNVCKPNVGAPLVTRDGLHGITSGWASSNCSNDPSPTVFTVVTAPDVRSWVEHILMYR